MFDLIPFETRRNKIVKKETIERVLFVKKMNKRASVASRTSIKVGPDTPLESAYPVLILLCIDNHRLSSSSSFSSNQLKSISKEHKQLLFVCKVQKRMFLLEHVILYSNSLIKAMRISSYYTKWVRRIHYSP